MRSDFNGHMRSVVDGYCMTHAGFSFRERNNGRVSIQNFEVAYKLTIANSCFKQIEEHMVTLNNGNTRTQIDYILARLNNRRSCKDYKVILSERITI